MSNNLFIKSFFFHQQGHNLKVNYIQNIDKDSVIKIMNNSTAKLTKDCFIVPTACGRTNGFNTAMVHVEVFKNNLWVWINQGWENIHFEIVWNAIYRVVNISNNIIDIGQYAEFETDQIDF